MKERGMLFSAPMVLALLNGTKTQTRRIVKPQPMEEDGQIYGGKIFGPEMYEPATCDKHGELVPGPEIFGIYTEDGDWGVKFPYGQPGERLWVRETWAIHPKDEKVVSNCAFRADGDFIGCAKWAPSIHMPRWASRIDLEITGVRAERLQDISEADAAAEGIAPNWIGSDLTGWIPEEHGYLPHDTDDEGRVPGVDIYDDCWTAKRCYQRLWESLNGAGSWDVNPWVWVVAFERIKP